MTTPHVLIIGASAIDTKGRSAAPITPGTSNPGDIRVSVGGVARNIAENLSRLGVATLLLSSVGDDEAGRHILAHTASSGVDISQVLVSPDLATGAYLAVLDEWGSRFVSISSMSAAGALTARHLYQRRLCFREASLLVIDANLSPAAMGTAFLLARRYGLPVCADPTSAGLAERLIPYLPELTLITPNPAEAEALCGHPVRPRRHDAIAAAKRLVGMGVKIAVVTLGELGACYATSEGSGHVPAIRCDVVDLTGAGDAMTAGIVFGLLEELPVDEAVRLGVAAATLTLCSRETVHQDLTLETLYDQLAI